MADADDVDALLSGDNDLAERDLRGADFQGLDLTVRDFRGAYLEKANLSGANLSHSILSRARIGQAKFVRSILKEADVRQTSLYSVDFSNADLSEAKFNGSLFAKTNLDHAILTGADFSGCNFQDGTTFDGALSDETTKFDGATIFRPLAKNAAFRFYKVERGKLVRLEEAETSSFSSVASDIANALPLIRTTQAALASALSTRPDPQAIGIGHNGPPTDSALADEEAADLKDALSILDEQIASKNPNQQVIAENTRKLQDHSLRVSDWISKRLDIFSDEFARSLGKGAGDIRLWIGMWIVLSGHLSKLIELITSAWKI